MYMIARKIWRMIKSFINYWYQSQYSQFLLPWYMSLLIFVSISLIIIIIFLEQIFMFCHKKTKEDFVKSS